jgi:hypothetical protein
LLNWFIGCSGVGDGNDVGWKKMGVKVVCWLLCTSAWLRVLVRENGFATGFCRLYLRISSVVFHCIVFL